MEPSRNVRVVRKLYEAFARRNEAALRRLLHPDVDWIQCAGFPGGDHRRGVDEVLEEVFSAVQSKWKGFAAEVDDYLDAGSTVVVLGRYTGEYADTGRSMVAVFAHVYELEDDRIVRFRQIADTQQMIEATES